MKHEIVILLVLIMQNCLCYMSLILYTRYNYNNLGSDNAKLFLLMLKRQYVRTLYFTQLMLQRRQSIRGLYFTHSTNVLRTKALTLILKNRLSLSPSFI